MRPEFIVAGKEVRDHVTSRRFIVIFAILLVICGYAIVTGMDQYHKTLDSYKQNRQQPWYQQQIQDLQQQIQKAQDRGAAQEEIDSLQAQLDSLLNPWMPSVMTVFYSLAQYFALIGMVLGIALGFDLISREKEEGSLKSLLSHPVYRDSVINGKTLGAAAVLATAMGATFLLTIAIVLFFGVVPSADEFLRIGAFFVLALLFCLTFFAVALATSTLASTSSMAVLYSLGVVIGLMIFSMFSYQIVQFIAGPPPEVTPGPVFMEKGVNAGTGAASGGAVDVTLAYFNMSAPPDATKTPEATTEPTIGPMPIRPGEPGSYDEWQKYYERQQLIQKALDSISPMTSFQNYIAQALIADNQQVQPLLSSYKMLPYGSDGKSTVWDALGSVWVNILVMIAEMIAAFGIAYVKFLRTDIR